MQELLCTESTSQRCIGLDYVDIAGRSSTRSNLAKLCPVYDRCRALTFSLAGLCSLKVFAGNCAL